MKYSLINCYLHLEMVQKIGACDTMAQTYKILNTQMHEWNERRLLLMTTKSGAIILLR